MDKAELIKRCEYIRKCLSSIEGFQEDKSDLLNLIRDLYCEFKKNDINVSKVFALIQKIENKYHEILLKSARPSSC